MSVAKNPIVMSDEQVRTNDNDVGPCSKGKRVEDSVVHGSVKGEGIDEPTLVAYGEQLSFSSKERSNCGGQEVSERHVIIFQKLVRPRRG